MNAMRGERKGSIVYRLMCGTSRMHVAWEC